MNDNSILMIFVGSLIVVILVLLYLYLATSKNLKKLEIINKELDESNSNKITEIAVLEEKIHSSEKLLENTSLEKKLIEQELSIRELANKNVDIDKDIAKTNQKFDTKFDSTFTELKENSEKIGLLYGNSQNQGNFGEYSLDLVCEQANYTEGHNYLR